MSINKSRSDNLCPQFGMSFEDSFDYKGKIGDISQVLSDTTCLKSKFEFEETLCLNEKNLMDSESTFINVCDSLVLECGDLIQKCISENVLDEVIEDINGLKKRAMEAYNSDDLRGALRAALCVLELEEDPLMMAVAIDAAQDLEVDDERLAAEFMPLLMAAEISLTDLPIIFEIAKQARWTRLVLKYVDLVIELEPDNESLVNLRIEFLEEFYEDLLAFIENFLSQDNDLESNEEESEEEVAESDEKIDYLHAYQKFILRWGGNPPIEERARFVLEESLPEYLPWYLGRMIEDDDEAIHILAMLLQERIETFAVEMDSCLTIPEQELYMQVYEHYKNDEYFEVIMITTYMHEVGCRDIRMYSMRLIAFLDSEQWSRVIGFIEDELLQVGDKYDLSTAFIAYYLMALERIGDETVWKIAVEDLLKNGYQNWFVWNSLAVIYGRVDNNEVALYCLYRCLEDDDLPEPRRIEFMIRIHSFKKHGIKPAPMVPLF